MTQHKKYYTVNCANKFAFFQDDLDGSSDGEVVTTKLPPKVNHRGETTKDILSSQRAVENSVKASPLQLATKALAVESVRGKVRVSVPPKSTAYGSPANQDKDDSPSVQENGHSRARDSFRSARGRGGSFGVNRNDQFDRHSRSGPVCDLKRRGGGGHNWGNRVVDFGGEEEVSPGATERIEQSSPSMDNCEESGLYQTEKTENESLVIGDTDLSLPGDQTIDFNEYKRIQVGKKASLPSFTRLDKITESHILTEKEMVEEGYQRYVKMNSDEEAETLVKSDTDDVKKRKEKTLNFFEYVHQEGGRVRLFPGYRGHGRGRGKSVRTTNGLARDGQCARSFSSLKRDAPDLEDSRAFPTLA